MAENDSTAYCYYCATTQPVVNFSPSRLEIRRGVFKGRCRTCVKTFNKQYRKDNPQKLRIYEERRLRDPDVVLRYRTQTRLRRYGLSPKEYAEMRERQHGRCALCSKEVIDERGLVGRGKTKCLSIDHCHKTGVVRGLLCGSCNRGLGSFKDNIGLLTAAIQYLQDFEKTRK